MSFQNMMQRIDCLSKMNRWRLIMWVTILSFPIVGCGQNVEEMLKLNRKAVKINGGINLNSVGFLSDNPLSYRSPMAWYASGNLNITAFGMSFPFQYSISNQGRSLSQPSNITSISPTYKWFKSDIGRISTSFSPYTLSGVNCTGVGIELTPSRFNFSAIGGKISKAVGITPEQTDINQITYERWLAGVMVSFNMNAIQLKYIVVKAFDKENSLNQLFLSSTVKPKDNLVNSLSIKTTLFKSLTFEHEFATSMLTNNTRLTEPYSGKQWQMKIYPLVQGNASTSLYNAFKTNLSYSIKKLKLTLGYERVDPNYMTLGGLYFQNDLEKFTFSPSLIFLKNRLNLSLSTGLQKNDLSKSRASKTERWVGSLNIGAKISKKVTANLSFSNFSSFTRNNPVKNPFSNQVLIGDTANVYQVSSNINSSVNYSIGGKRKQTLVFTFTHQRSSNVTGRLENAKAFGINVSSSGSPFETYVNTVAYSFTLPTKNITMNLNANSNLSKSATTKNWFCGPTLSISSAPQKGKPSLSGGITYNLNYTNALLSNNVLNYRASFSHNPKWVDERYGKVTLTSSAMYLMKLPTSSVGKRLNEITIMFNLAYTIK